MSVAGRPGRATITQVAQLAGVSISTASKALSGGRVNPQLAERVRAVAKQLGYSPHSLAQALRTGRARILGLQVAYITHYTTAAICEGVLDQAYARGYAVAMCSTQYKPDVEHTQLDILARQHVAAVIVLPISVDAAPYLELQARGTPVVCMQRRPPGLSADLVASDYRAGTYAAVRHLLEQGRRRVAMIAPTTTYGSNEDREAGYHAAYADAGLAAPADLICFEPLTVDDAYAATRTLLSRAQRPDAFVAAGSNMVTPALACLRDFGIVVPDDVAFVGAGDVEWARLAAPPLTMIEIDGEQVGRLAVDMALARLEPEGRALPPREAYLPTTLVIRASSGGRGVAVASPLPASGPGDARRSIGQQQESEARLWAMPK